MAIGGMASLKYKRKNFSEYLFRFSNNKHSNTMCYLPEIKINQILSTYAQYIAALCKKGLPSEKVAIGLAISNH